MPTDDTPAGTKPGHDASSRIGEHFVAAANRGEACCICGAPATHKIGEEIPPDEPPPGPPPLPGMVGCWWRHNLTNYVCCQHFKAIMGPAAPCPAGAEADVAPPQQHAAEAANSVIENLERLMSKWDGVTYEDDYDRLAEFTVHNLTWLLPQIRRLAAATAAPAPPQQQAPPPQARCRCGRGLIYNGPNDADPWCEGCSMSAKICDCVPPPQGRQQSPTAWVPVTERLPPEECAVYLVSTKNYMDVAYWRGGEWCNQDVITPYVTHWMPLPAPPTSGDAAGAPGDDGTAATRGDRETYVNSGTGQRITVPAGRDPDDFYDTPGARSRRHDGGPSPWVKMDTTPTGAGDATGGITAEELRRLRELEAKASRAPWGAFIREQGHATDPPAHGILLGVSMVPVDKNAHLVPDDAELIAALRNAAPRLIAAAEGRAAAEARERVMREALAATDKAMRRSDGLIAAIRFNGRLTDDQFYEWGAVFTAAQQAQAAVGGAALAAAAPPVTPATGEAGR